MFFERAIQHIQTMTPDILVLKSGFLPSPHVQLCLRQYNMRSNGNSIAEEKRK